MGGVWRRAGPRRKKEVGQFSLWERPNQRAWQERAELRPGGGSRGRGQGGARVF